MHSIVFDVELSNELDGTSMNFEYEYEVDSDLTEDEVQEIANDIVGGFDHGFYDQVLSWISINPSVSYIEMEEPDADL